MPPGADDHAAMDSFQAYEKPLRLTIAVPPLRMYIGVRKVPPKLTISVPPLKISLGVAAPPKLMNSVAAAGNGAIRAARQQH